VLKWVIKTIFIGSTLFALLIINVKISPIFRKIGAHFVEKNDVWKKQILSTIEVWMLWTCKNIYLFMLSFEHVKFSINGKCSKKIMTLQIIMFHLWSFKHTKIQF
jgi:hypothetical protein